VQRHQLEGLRSAARDQQAVRLTGQSSLEGPQVTGVGADQQQHVAGPGGLLGMQHHPVAQERLDVDSGQGAAEVVSLHLVAPVVPQVGQLRRHLHSLGHDLEVEAVRHVDDRQRDRRLVRLGGDVADAGDVDLQRRCPQG
jgi:hypothetical protein